MVLQKLWVFFEFHLSHSLDFFPFDFAGDVSRGIVRIANNFTPIIAYRESTSGEKIRFCWRWKRIANNFTTVSDYRESISSGTIQLYRRRFATNRANWVQSWTLSHPLFRRSTSGRLPVRRLAFLNSSRFVKYLTRIDSVCCQVLRTRKAHISLFHGSLLSVVGIDFVRIESNRQVPHTNRLRLGVLYMYTGTVVLWTESQSSKDKLLIFKLLVESYNFNKAVLSWTGKKECRIFKKTLDPTD